MPPSRWTNWPAASSPAKSASLLGLNSLDPLLLQDNCAQALLDAASVLERFVAAGGVVSKVADARTRYGTLAAAVRRAMTDG